MTKRHACPGLKRLRTDPAPRWPATHPCPTTWRVFLRALFGVLVLATAGSLSAQTMRATVDRQTVAAGETVTFSLIFDGVAQAGAPNLPQFPNMTVLPGISQRS